MSKPTGAPLAPPFPTTRTRTVVATRSAFPGATPPPPLKPAVPRPAAALKPPEAGRCTVDALFGNDAIRPSYEGNKLPGDRSAAAETTCSHNHHHLDTEPDPPPATFAASLRDLRPVYPPFLHDLPPNGSLLSAVARLLRQRVDPTDAAVAGQVCVAAAPLPTSEAAVSSSPPPPKSSPSASSSSSASPVVEPSPNQTRKRRKKARMIGIRPKRRPPPPDGAYGSPALLVPAVPATHPPTVTPPSKRFRAAPSSSEGSTTVTTVTTRTTATEGPRAVRFAPGSKEPRNEWVGAGAIASRGMGAFWADCSYGGSGSGHHRTKTTAAASARALAGAEARRRTTKTKKATTRHR